MTKATQPKPKRAHPPTPIGKLLNKYEISLSLLSGLCGDTFSSTSTLHRYVNQSANPAITKYLDRVIAEVLPPFLIERGIDKSEIDQQMSDALKGDYQPMISQRLELDPDECRWFGFLNAAGEAVDPFSRKPSCVEEVFVTPPFQKIIDRVVDAIRYQGFVCVVGSIGSGKSTLRDLMEHYVSTQPGLRLVWPEFYEMNNVTAMQIADSILTELGVERIPTSSVRRGREVKNQLSAVFQSGKRIAIAFDECHKLNDKAISSLKNFLEMSSGGFQRYLGVILFGQPSIETRLRDPRFQEIFERIVMIHMPGTESEDADKQKIPAFSDYAADYLAHRLKYVGLKVEDVFDEDAVSIICRQATTPLSLGNIANAALRLSKKKFNNKKVKGAAIRTETLFESRDTQNFTRRN